MTAGNYHIIVHYYQPNFPSYEIGIGVYSGAGSGLPGSMKLPYCPNVNGCRERFVRDVKGSAFVFEDGTSKLRFDMTGGRDAWIVSYSSYKPYASYVCSLQVIFPVTVLRSFLYNILQHLVIYKIRQKIKTC